MKTLVLPSWNWSCSMLTELRRSRTPWRSSPLQEGQVSLVRMAYLGGPPPSASQPPLTLPASLTSDLCRNLLKSRL